MLKNRSFIIIGMALLFLSGCAGSLVYDVTNLDAPILMNPQCSFQEDAGITTEEICVYSGKVTKGSTTSASPGYGTTTATTTQNTALNDAQISASKVLGGQPNRAITNVQFEVVDITINALLAIGSTQSITATGKVIEFTKTSEQE
jgi:hypothetical protein